MNANQIDKFIMYCEPTSQNVEYLAKILIHIKKNDALKIKFEPCYTLVYNWCKLNNLYELIRIKNNIIQYIINNLIIIDDNNYRMLSDVFYYFFHFEPNWQFELLNTLQIVKKRRKMITILLKNLTIKNNLSNDIFNIIHQYI